MARGRIYYDATSGQLVRDLAWALDVPLKDEFIWAEVEPCDHGDLQEDVPNCPIHQHHTFPRLRHLCLRLLGGPWLPDFVHVFLGGGYYVTDRFAGRLRRSSLAGFVLRDVIHIAANDARVACKQIYALESDRPVAERFSKVADAANLCPHCGKEPMVCPGCGQLNTPCCEVCGKRTVCNADVPEYSDPKGFVIETHEGALVANGKTWTGSACFGLGARFCVTRRAKRWLESTHTEPLSFKPILVDVEGMDPALLKKLKEDR